MTIDNLTSEFNLIHLDESNRLMTADRTPIKSLGKSLVVSPESAGPESYDYSVSSDGSSTSSDEVTPFHREVVPSISEHKLDELAGRHAVEPLLKENPNRFVLFPIEDNEVSARVICFSCIL